MTVSSPLPWLRAGYSRAAAKRVPGYLASPRARVVRSPWRRAYRPHTGLRPPSQHAQLQSVRLYIGSLQRPPAGRRGQRPHRGAPAASERRVPQPPWRSAANAIVTRKAGRRDDR